MTISFKPLDYSDRQKARSDNEYRKTGFRQRGSKTNM